MKPLGHADCTVMLRSPADVRRRLREAVKKLYSECTNADDMRDMAQSLEVLLEDIDDETCEWFERKLEENH